MKLWRMLQPDEGCGQRNRRDRMSEVIFCYKFSTFLSWWWQSKTRNGHPVFVSYSLDSIPRCKPRIAAASQIPERDASSSCCPCRVMLKRKPQHLSLYVNAIGCRPRGLGALWIYTVYRLMQYIHVLLTLYCMFRLQNIKNYWPKPSWPPDKFKTTILGVTTSRTRTLKW